MKRLFFFFAALAVLVSCNREKEIIPVADRQVSIVAKATETKTVLKDNAVEWEAGDAIALNFTKTEDNSIYLTTFSTIGGGATAVFKGTLPDYLSEGYDQTGYAVYPLTAMSDDGTVKFGLPSEVAVDATGTFSASENLSSAKVSLDALFTEGSEEVEFLNAFSIIRFKLNSGVKSLKITADAPLVGEADMAFDDNGRLAKSGEFTSSSSVITVTPPADGTFDGTTAYNVLVFPGTYTTLTAEMVDADGCTYTKENTGSYVFEAAKFYNFNFTDPSKFDRTYYFTATGRTFAQGEFVQTVFDDVADEVLTADADLKFTGHTTHEAYEANKSGYAVYPAASYSASGMTYSLPADGSATGLAELWTAPISLQNTEAAFTSVTAALAKVSFTVPAGVASAVITSDKGLVGTAPMTVTDGALVAGAGDGKEVTLSASQAYEFFVYPVEGATLTVTLTDAADQTITKSVSLTVAAGKTETITLDGELDFDKEGNFNHEGFTDGNNGNSIEF